MKLNKRGQTLVVFLIILPLIVGLIAYLVDISLKTYENTRNYQTTKMIIKKALEKDMDENAIKKLFKENNIEINNLEISFNDNEVIIKNEYEIDSLFGKMIGFDKYKIKLNVKGIDDGDNIRFIKEWKRLTWLN